MKRGYPTMLQRLHRTQTGAFLLEALVGILIISFGVLGIVGLQAQALKVTNDSQYRAEAMYLANELVARMWADNLATLKASYDSSLGGAGYNAFKAKVKSQLGGAWVQDPRVEFDNGNIPSLQSVYVIVTVYFKMPGDATTHQTIISGVVGVNN
jgi:type IV pilus assembly protein PilV